MDKNTVLKKLVIFAAPIIILLIVFIYIMDNTSPSNPEPSADEEITQEQLEELASSIESTSDSADDFEEFMIEEIEEGSGEEVKEGDTVRVHYKGTLIDGTQFDSSYDRGEPFEFTVGAGMVIQGWEQGLVGMKMGGKRQLSIPSALGYGESGSPPSIPPKAGLIFEIELLEIESSQ